MTCCLTSTAFTMPKIHPRYAVGFEAGWGAPYGFGFQAAALLRPEFEVYSGLGLNISGFKAGLGARYYYNFNESFALHAGAAYAWSSGVNTINFGIRDKDFDSIYSYAENNLLHLRTGVRFKQDTLAVLVTTGWGFTQKNAEAHFVSGLDAYRSAANTFSAGGFELSVAMLLYF